MIDCDQLTEALNKTGLAEFMVNEDTEPQHVRIVRDAARLLLDFPTDEMVDAANRGMAEYDADVQREWSGNAMARAGLEAVRQVMFGEQDAQVETG